MGQKNFVVILLLFVLFGAAISVYFYWQKFLLPAAQQHLTSGAASNQNETQQNPPYTLLSDLPSNAVAVYTSGLQYNQIWETNNFKSQGQQIISTTLPYSIVFQKSSWSPDGQKFIFLGYNNLRYLVNFQNHKISHILPEIGVQDISTINEIIWSPDSSKLVVLLNQSQPHLGTILLYNLATDTTKTLFTGMPKGEYLEPEIYTDSENFVYYSLSRSFVSDSTIQPGIYRVSMDTGKNELLLPRDTNGPVSNEGQFFAFDPQRKAILYGKVNDQQIFEFSLANHTSKVLISIPGSESALGMIYLAPKGNRVLLAP